ncbi:hypothetical protein D3C79_1036830 [compost metagenome]
MFKLGLDRFGSLSGVVFAVLVTKPSTLFRPATVPWTTLVYSEIAPVRLLSHPSQPEWPISR